MNSRDDFTACCGEDNGQTISCLDGKSGRTSPAASINHDTVSLDGTPFSRRGTSKSRSSTGQHRCSICMHDGLDPGRVRLIHPDNVPSQSARHSFPARPDQRRIVAHVQAHIACKCAGARVHLGEVDPSTGKKLHRHQRRKGGISSSSFSGASG